MADDDVMLLRRCYAAFDRRDPAAVIDALDPEIEWVVPEGSGAIGGVRRGHEEFLQFMLLFPDDRERFRSEPEEFLDAGDRVVVLGHHRGTTEDGDPVEIPFAHVWTIRDGVAARFQGHSDSARLRELLRAQPSAKSDVVR